MTKKTDDKPKIKIGKDNKKEFKETKKRISQ